MITTILFDLDGTLLPMDQDAFVKDYLGRIAKYLTPHGYDPSLLVKALWAGTGTMVQNDGKDVNEAVFWATFHSVLGRDARKDEALFEEFYRGEFQNSKYSCGFNPEAAVVIRKLREMGYRLVLATNPLFPSVATQSRVRWAGLCPEDFALITTYEDSRFSKPNPDYYREILGKLHLDSAECLMVGNDVAEDMVAQTLGMQVFLLTDCLINKNQADISQYPNGGFPELLRFIQDL